MRLIKQIGFFLGVILLGVASFYLTSLWLDRGMNRPSNQTTARLGTNETATSRQPGTGVTYCEMSFPVDNCPAFPGVYAITKEKLLRDTWDGADKSPDRCHRRAEEYHSFCKFQGTVTARFFRDGRVSSSRSFP